MEILLAVMVSLVFLVGLAGLGVAYWDQRKLLAENRAQLWELTLSLKVAATTGRRDIAAAFTDLVNAVQFHMPATGGTPPAGPVLRAAKSDLELWQEEQKRVLERLDRKRAPANPEAYEEAAGDD